MPHPHLKLMELLALFVTLMARKQKTNAPEWQYIFQFSSVLR